MYKLFILLFIIFIINYFLLDFKEHYNDILNIDLCSSKISDFNSLYNLNTVSLSEIKNSCKAMCPYSPTVGLDYFYNNDGENKYTITYRNPHLNQNNNIREDSLSLNGKWGDNIIFKLNINGKAISFPWTWDENVVKRIYDEGKYPPFIDTNELGGYFHNRDRDTICFKSCNVLYVQQGEDSIYRIIKIELLK
jgi:hypothetical protein